MHTPSNLTDLSRRVRAMDAAPSRTSALLADAARRMRAMEQGSVPTLRGIFATLILDGIEEVPDLTRFAVEVA